MHEGQNMGIMIALKKNLLQKGGGQGSLERGSATIQAIPAA
jgi:hypothetical protein